VPVLSSSVQVVDSERDLGVVIDSHLTMADHVTAVSFVTDSYAARPLLAAPPTFICENYIGLGLRLITRSLSVEAAMTLVQSFYRAKLRVVARYCQGKLSVCPSVCDVEVYVIMQTYRGLGRLEFCKNNFTAVISLAFHSLFLPWYPTSV